MILVGAGIWKADAERRALVRHGACFRVAVFLAMQSAVFAELAIHTPAGLGKAKTA